MFSNKEILNLLNTHLIDVSRERWVRHLPNKSFNISEVSLPNELWEEISFQELLTNFKSNNNPRPYDGNNNLESASQSKRSNGNNEEINRLFSRGFGLIQDQRGSGIPQQPEHSDVSIELSHNTLGPLSLSSISTGRDIEISRQLPILATSLQTIPTTAAGVDVSLLLQSSPFMIFSCQESLSSFCSFAELLHRFAEKNSFSEQESLFLSGELLRCLNLSTEIVNKFKQTDLNFEKLFLEKDRLEEEFNSVLSRLFQLRDTSLGGPGVLFFFFFGNYLTILQEKRKLDYVILGFSRAHFEFTFFAEYFFFLSNLKNKVSVVPLAELLFFNFGLIIIRKYLAKFLVLFEKVCLFREELKFLSSYLKDIEIATSLPEKAALFLGEKKAEYSGFVTFGQEVFRSITARAVFLQAEESLLKKGENLLPFLIELLSPRIADKVIIPQLKYFFLDLLAISINYLEGGALKKDDADAVARLSTSPSFFVELHTAFSLLLQKKETNRKALALFLDKLRFFPLSPVEIRCFSLSLKNYLKNYYIFEISGSCERAGLEYNAKTFFSRFQLDFSLPVSVVRRLSSNFFGRILPENFYSSASFSNRLGALQGSPVEKRSRTGFLLQQGEEVGKKEVEELSFTEGFSWGETLLQHIPPCFRGTEHIMTAPILLLRVELPAAKDALSLLKSIQRFMLLDLSRSEYVLVSKELLTWQLNGIFSSILHLNNSIKLAESILSKHNVEQRFKSDFFFFPSATAADTSVVFFSEDWLTKLYKQKDLHVLRSILTSVI